MLLRIFHLFILLITSHTLTAQVGIGTTTPASSASLDITSTSKGILIPRMTSSQRESISSPANGLMVYQTDGTAGYWYYDGTLWTTFSKNNVARMADWANTSSEYTTKRLDSFLLAPRQYVEINWSTSITGAAKSLYFEILNITTERLYESTPREIFSYSNGTISGSGTIMFSNSTSTEKLYVIYVSKSSTGSSTGNARFFIKSF